MSPIEALSPGDDGVQTLAKLTKDRDNFQHRAARSPENFIRKHASSLVNLSAAYSSAERHSDALSAARDDLLTLFNVIDNAITETSAPDLASASESIANALNNIAITFAALGKNDDNVIVALEGARSVAERVLGSRHTSTATCVHNLGKIWWSRGELKYAQSYFDEALSIFVEKLGLDHPNTTECRNSLVEVTQEIEGGKR